jgi:anti-sigma regulatory factor (Ser/Thr protein kinase)
MDQTDHDRTEFWQLSLPAEPAQLSALRQQLRDHIAGLPISPQCQAETVLAVDEAATNAVQHAYASGRPGQIELTIWTEPGTLCIQVCDHGHWPAEAPPPNPGLGITLMHRLVDGVLIEHGDSGTRVLLRHRISTPQDDPVQLNPRRRGPSRNGHANWRRRPRSPNP